LSSTGVPDSCRENSRSSATTSLTASYDHFKNQDSFFFFGGRALFFLRFGLGLSSGFSEELELALCFLRCREELELEALLEPMASLRLR
jgi:hypothetical protein